MRDYDNHKRYVRNLARRELPFKTWQSISRNIALSAARNKKKKEKKTDED